MDTVTPMEVIAGAVWSALRWRADGGPVMTFSEAAWTDKVWAVCYLAFYLIQKQGGIL